jgi:translation initiation factor 2 subunit 2
MAELAPDEAVPDEVAAMFDLSLKKKKKKKKATEVEAVAPKEEGVGEEDAADSTKVAASSSSTEFELDPPIYTYSQLLNRVVDFVHLNNPELTDKKRFTMKPPQLMRVGTKKTLWVNFQEICSMMRRNADHVFQFMMAELGVEGSIDGNKRLVIRGKFVPKYIESLLRKYIGEYVACQMCRSFNTSLTRDSVSRLFFVGCQDCGSSRSVAQIRAGYHATTKADRRAIRNA